MFPNESRRISADSYFATAKRESVSFRLTRVLGGRNCLSGHGLLASLLGPALPWTAFLVLSQYPCSVCRISIPPFARNGSTGVARGLAGSPLRRRALSLSDSEYNSAQTVCGSGPGNCGTGPLAMTPLILAQFRVKFSSPLCRYSKLNFWAVPRGPTHRPTSDGPSPPDRQERLRTGGLRAGLTGTDART